MHPSEPNYLAIVGGSTFGVTDDAPPSANADKVGAAQSIFGLALSAGKTARTYAESMPENCHGQITRRRPSGSRSMRRGTTHGSTSPLSESSA